MKDLERLNQLGEASSSYSSPTLSTSNSPKTALALQSSSTSKQQSQPSIGVAAVAPTQKLFSSQMLGKSPTLSKGDFSFTLDRNAAAKSKALAILKKTPIEKSNPNLIKYRGTQSGKRKINDLLPDVDSDREAKKRKAAEVEAFKNERIKHILGAKSTHEDLIVARENSNQDKYFEKLEKKEMLEEKMLNTMKMACKAVVCPICKYKAFSAAERCKTERHPFKVIDAEKRFFECEDCTNRTVTLFLIPKQSCPNCQGSRWKRCGMIRERKTQVGEQLSIRGGEEAFLGSVQTNGNINLCVPDS